MELPVSTYALLFPAVSLLFLSYTNRFLHLSALIRKLHTDWLANHDGLILDQISNLRRRLSLIRGMQLLGALCLFCCVMAMLATIFQFHSIANIIFIVALSFMAVSLLGLTVEVWISGGALRIMLRALEKSVAQDRSL
ncbi:MAG: DUF2721 domain-containing protein [Akkermansiaceae bacterium]